MNDLEVRLADLGGRLHLDGGSLVDDVLARLDEPITPTGAGHGRWWWLRVAVVVAVVAAVAAAATPGSRRTVARWLGFDQVRIEVRPDLDITGPPVSMSAGLLGPGDSRIVEVAGETILVSALDGRVDRGVITKSVGSSDSIIEVQVDGKSGLWIEGETHQFAYVTAEGESRTVRAAADTLLWQDGPVLYRVEGFDTVDDAVAFAAGIGPP